MESAMKHLLVTSLVSSYTGHEPNSRVIVFDNMPSIPYFLCFIEILGWQSLITYDPYLIF